MRSAVGGDRGSLEGAAVTDTNRAKDQLAEYKETFAQCQEAWSDNHKSFEDDYRFAREDDAQWPEEIRKQRNQDSRPCLTMNRMPAFARQVTNDARQNKPQPKVRPVDSGSDPETAQVITGLIRNIEQISNADAAYDTAIECAALGGFGFWRLKLDHAHDDSFDLDILIDRIINPCTVYGDPWSTAVDSSDWDRAFITDLMSEKEFERLYPDAQKVNWQGDKADGVWRTEDTILRAEYWHRSEVPKTLVKLSNGMIIDAVQYELQRDVLEVNGITVVADRQTRGYKVKQCIMTGAEILEENDWPGKYIPIVPVYGDEVVIDGKRQFRSLIHDAKDAQRMFNYWRTCATELVALAPKVPWVGPKGFTGEDDAKWVTANTANHAYLEYEGGQAPQRFPMDSGAAAGALQEALSASDDMKAIMGLYDASLGQRSNETSGIAIESRKREGDTATFHFVDNLSRAVRHSGRILIDLIPKVYTGERIIRTLGEDGHAQNVKIGEAQPAPETESMPGRPKLYLGVYDLAAGKYDLVVESGPSFGTKRTEAALQMTEMIRANPAVAPLIGDILAKNLDWPGADEIADRMRKMLPPQIQGEQPLPPEIETMIEEGKAMIAQLQEENAKLRQSEAKEVAGIEKAQVDKDKNQLEREKLGLEAYKLQTDRMVVEKELTVSKTNLDTVDINNQALIQAAASFQTSATAIVHGMAEMQAGIAQILDDVRRPRVKRGVAAKNPVSGKYEMESVETIEAA